MNDNDQRVTMLARMLLVVALCSGASVSNAASFPCEKPQGRIEKAICADSELSRLDEHLGQYYGGARLALQDDAGCLKADQRHWLKTVRNVCADNACLKTVYLDRLSELNALQPGVTYITYFTLPERPALVWVIPPAGDKVAAPDNPKAKPLEASGALVDEVSDGDGFVLRTPTGESLVVTLMLLDGQTAVQLPELARHIETTYSVRGYGVRDETGRISYEPSRCIYIHRLPDS